MTIIICLMLASMALGKTIYVNCTAPGLNDGTTWKNGYTSLQTALDAAVAGDEIWVAKGTYKPSSAYDLTDDPSYYHFRLINDVKIYGGFTGSFTGTETVSGRKNFGPGGENETILSGDIGIAGDNSDNCYHVIYNPQLSQPIDETAVIDGFTITGGNAAGGGTESYGGGMYNRNSSPTVSSVAFVSNAADYGGGLYNTNSNPFVVNAVFISNTATYRGGAIYNNNNSPQIVNSTFALNAAGYGGAIANNVVNTPSISNCIIWGNSASTNGNEIAVFGGTTTLNYSCYKNGANDVYVSSGTFTATNNNITSDPKMVDAAAGDLRLNGNSPAVNTGSNSYLTRSGETFSDDVRGKTRVQNARVDMGAYEWTTGTDPAARIHYVRYNAIGKGSGASWTNAFTTLQPALDAAVAGEQIWVARGTYKPTSSNGLTNTSRYYHFRLKNSIGIYGGFAGTETTLGQRTDFGAGGLNETILSGDLGTGGDYSDNCYHVINLPDENPDINSTAVLDGFTVSYGNANGENPPEVFGGGMYSDHSSPTMNNVIFSFNKSSSAGGGGYLYYSSPAMTNVSFLSNESGNGGGAYLYECSSAMTNILVAQNKGSKGGGGLYFSGTSNSPQITNATITANNVGGGIYINCKLTTTLNNTIIWGNLGFYSDDLYNMNGPLVLNNCCYDITIDKFISTTTPTFTNCITSNPQFADVSDADFRITKTSPCTDAGNNSYNSLSYDIRGSGCPRKLNKTTGAAGTIDIGAYEYQVDDPLPVELNSFSAAVSGSEVILRWSTAAEVNNYGFEIERAVMSSEFGVMSYEKIGFVAGSGNSNSAKTYSFTDNTAKAGKYSYRLKQIDNDGQYKYSGTVDVNMSSFLPAEYALEQNYPNPFNPSTVIRYNLPLTGNVELKVYDMLGREVATLVSTNQVAGSYNITFDAGNLASGIYIARLKAGSFVKSVKMQLIK